MEALINTILGLIGAGVLSAAGVFIRRFLGDKAAEQVMALIESAVGYGKRAAKRKLGDAAEKIEFDNEVVDQAFSFVIQRAPKWVRWAGFTEGLVRELVEGQLENKKDN